MTITANKAWDDRIALLKEIGLREAWSNVNGLLEPILIPIEENNKKDA